MLPRVLEEGQRIMKLGVDLHVYIISNDSNSCRPNHPAKTLRVRQWNHPVSCRFKF